MPKKLILLEVEEVNIPSGRVTFVYDAPTREIVVTLHAPRFGCVRAHLCVADSGSLARWFADAQKHAFPGEI